MAGPCNEPSRTRSNLPSSRSLSTNSLLVRAMPRPAMAASIACEVCEKLIPSNVVSVEPPRRSMNSGQNYGRRGVACVRRVLRRTEAASALSAAHMPLPITIAACETAHCRLPCKSMTRSDHFAQRIEDRPCVVRRCELGKTGTHRSKLTFGIGARCSTDGGHAVM